MTQTSSLVRLAAKHSLQIRVQNGIEMAEPCDIYKLIHKLCVELQSARLWGLSALCARATSPEGIRALVRLARYISKWPAWQHR